MISILPEHAPPSNDTMKLSLIIADDSVVDFTEEHAMDILSEYAEWMVQDINSMESMKLLPGKITIESLNIALKFIVVEDQYGNENKHWTNTYHNLVRIKFMLPL